eukprot:747205-Hanusia_phi.AAC.1
MSESPSQLSPPLMSCRPSLTASARVLQNASALSGLLPAPPLHEDMCKKHRALGSVASERAGRSCPDPSCLPWDESRGRSRPRTFPCECRASARSAGPAREEAESTLPLPPSFSPQSSTYLGDAKGDSILLAELLQLGDDAVSDVDGALGVETVHGGLDRVELVLDGEVDEVGEEESRWGNRHCLDFWLFRVRLLLLLGISLLDNQTVVLRVQHPLNLRKPPRLSGLAHLVSNLFQRRNSFLQEVIFESSLCSLQHSIMSNVTCEQRAIIGCYEMFCPFLRFTSCSYNSCVSLVLHFPHLWSLARLSSFSHSPPAPSLPSPPSPLLLHIGTVCSAISHVRDN